MCFKYLSIKFHPDQCPICWQFDVFFFSQIWNFKLNKIYKCYDYLNVNIMIQNNPAGGWRDFIQECHGFLTGGIYSSLALTLFWHVYCWEGENTRMWLLHLVPTGSHQCSVRRPRGSSVTHYYEQGLVAKRINLLMGVTCGSSDYRFWPRGGK